MSDKLRSQKKCFSIFLMERHYYTLKESSEDCDVNIMIALCQEKINTDITAHVLLL